MPHHVAGAQPLGRRGRSGGTLPDGHHTPLYSGLTRSLDIPTVQDRYVPSPRAARGG